MQICSKCSAENPDSAKNCHNCQANLSEWSNAAVALKRYQENSRVTYVRVTVAHDCCPACSQAEGAYPKDQAPHLPIEGCSHKLGCRCFYQPFLNELYP